MGKKIIFLGSIVSFVILLVVSFTSVVGYQTVTSSLKDSPLFTVRTKRAINEEPESIFIYNYFKTFKPLIIPFPMRDEYIAAIETAGFSQVNVLGETVFPIEFMDNDPNIAKIAKDSGITPEKLTEVAESVVSLKVSASKNE